MTKLQDPCAHDNRMIGRIIFCRWPASAVSGFVILSTFVIRISVRNHSFSEGV